MATEGAQAALAPAPEDSAVCARSPDRYAPILPLAGACVRTWRGRRIWLAIALLGLAALSTYFAAITLTPPPTRFPLFDVSRD